MLVQGSLTQLDYPDSTGTQALGLNNNGIVVGFYTDAVGKYAWFHLQPDDQGMAVDRRSGWRWHDHRQRHKR